jgi:hypothetical protein
VVVVKQTLLVRLVQATAVQAEAVEIHKQVEQAYRVKVMTAVQHNPTHSINQEQAVVVQAQSVEIQIAAH